MMTGVCRSANPGEEMVTDPMLQLSAECTMKALRRHSTSAKQVVRVTGRSEPATDCQLVLGKGVYAFAATQQRFTKLTMVII
jgi:hypothetical protein